MSTDDPDPYLAEIKVSHEAYVRGAERHAAAIASYCQSQAEIWRQVPYLAYELAAMIKKIDGGAEEAPREPYRHCYETGIWLGDPDSLPADTWGVDCADGTIVTVQSADNGDVTWKPASSPLICGLYEECDHLCAEKVVWNIQAQILLAEEVLGSARLETTRTAIQAGAIELGLEKTYTRTQS